MFVVNYKSSSSVTLDLTSRDRYQLHDQSKLIMCEGLCRWMKEHLFVLERKVLLKLEKDLRQTKKFKDNGQTLFTAKSGWALKEVHFNLDGADLLD